MWWRAGGVRYCPDGCTLQVRNSSTNTRTPNHGTTTISTHDFLPDRPFCCCGDPFLKISGGLGFAYIGRWNRNNPNEAYDNFTMTETEYTHPQFIEDLATSYDLMLMKLTQQSSKAYIKLNENPD